MYRKRLKNWCIFISHSCIMNSTSSFFLSQLRGAGSPRDSHVGEEPASTGRDLVHARRDELTWEESETCICKERGEARFEPWTSQWELTCLTTWVRHRSHIPLHCRLLVNFNLHTISSYHWSIVLLDLGSVSWVLLLSTYTCLGLHYVTSQSSMRPLT